MEVLEGLLLLTIRDNIAVNLDHVCLDNQSHYGLDVIEFQSELCDTQSPFMDIIGMNEKCCKLNRLLQKVSDFSYKTTFFFRGKLKIVQSKTFLFSAEVGNVGPGVPMSCRV